jgi:hypothetical protein
MASRQRELFIAACSDLLLARRKPTVPEVEGLVRDYYRMPGNAAGGSLHVVLDDHNVEDSSVEFCVEYARSEKDHCGEWLAAVLSRMSKTQRAKLASGKHA